MNNIDEIEGILLAILFVQILQFTFFIVML